MDYDVAFLGSGHANRHAAQTLADNGKKVAIIEEDNYGGTCPNWGCNAKFLLDGPFSLIDQLNQYQGKGIDSVPQVNWSDLMKYKHEQIDPYNDKFYKSFNDAGMEVMHGHGEIVDENTFSVDGQQHTAEYMVIGTGRRPAELDIPGKEHLHDSRDFLDLEEMPKHITFIGAGYITMEFASMAIMMGSQVDIVQHSNHALKGFYSGHVEKVVGKLQGQGVKFHFNDSVKKVEKNSGCGLNVITEKGETIITDYVLNAIGRVPNVENIGLENVGIKTEKDGIKVDDHLRTTSPKIYASGDVVNKPQPKGTPVATFESNYIADQILGDTDTIEYPSTPSVVYTMPRIGQVGVSVDVAKENPDEYHTVEINYGAASNYEFKNENGAQLIMVLDQDDYLVGASVLGNDADNFMNIFNVIIDEKLTQKDINRHIGAFPSASYGIIGKMSTYLKS